MPYNISFGIYFRKALTLFSMGGGGGQYALLARFSYAASREFVVGS